MNVEWDAAWNEVPQCDYDTLPTEGKHWLEWTNMRSGGLTVQGLRKLITLHRSREKE